MKNYGLILMMLILLITNTPMKSQSPTGIFDQSTDIGKVKFKGSASYDPTTERYDIIGAGRNIWDHDDEFQFLYKKVDGDFILYSMLKWISKGVAEHRKAGLMIRESLDPGSPYVSAAFHGDGLVAMQFRLNKDSATREIRALAKYLSVLQIEKKEDSVIMYASDTGKPLDKIGQIAMKFSQKQLYVGLFVCSHNVDVTEEAVFINTRLVLTAKTGFVPYKDYIGSKLEIINIETSMRSVIYESQVPFEAPNWSKDGKYLVINSRGLLYRMPAIGGVMEKIDTGVADDNNNDHGFSPDGKLMAISSTPKDSPFGHSHIYTFPSSGGAPTKITNIGASYWHGWSPDGKYLVYTANRNNRLNIFRIPSDGGDEVQMTQTDFLDDGPEYSTDGKWIWFNSNRTGTMEIWRMNADGSQPVQITNDEFQNWFPHQSPDGKWIAFVSYYQEVNMWDHPFYKQVMIRIMKSDGANLKVLTHLYGGQGTMNVPSWSPDSKLIAFVSNTDKIG